MFSDTEEAISSPSLALPPMALVLGMVSITAGASFAQRLFPVVGAEGATALRLVIGALFLLGVARPWRMRFGHKRWAPVIAYGAMMGGMNLLFYMSLQTLPLGVAIAIEFIGPLGLATVSSRRALDLLWIALAATGLVLLVLMGASAARVDLVGSLFALAAGLCWAGYMVFGRMAGRDFGGSATSLGMTIAALIVLPIGFSHAGPHLFEPNVLVLALIVGLLSSALPYSLEMFALRHLSAKTFGILSSGEPAVGAVIGAILLGQALPLSQWVGIGLISCASIGTSLAAIRERKAAERSQSRAEAAPPFPPAL
ncbi:EamA family transporter [Segnochrobactrum spirostomi]|uniref:DMT family transporter n=1 Tax=Segnochrobactrum spirostomi TaxID=2608987 RepID=A0A6A7Y1I4_9HYPH|nr:DMT family transporter [Segnochrobactrum spirostomi]MQT11759.1 DMT family transporter [Segnochrobactrum spirostomi]